MLDAVRDAAADAAGHARGDLEANRMLARAIVKAVEIVGEAASKVTPETQQLLPTVPWVDIIGMRHRLIHAYYDVDLDIVWGTVEVDLPPLIAALEAWLARARP